MALISWLWAAVVAVLLFFALRGKRRGFVRSAFSVLSIVVSLLGALLAGPILQAVLFGGKGMRALSFVAAYLLARLVVGAAGAALDIVARLPVLHEMNALAGLLLGLAEGFLNVWVACLLLDAFHDASWVRDVMEMVNASALLRALYEGNPLARIGGIR